MRVSEHRLRLRTPLATARGEIQERVSLVLHAHDGLGEACPLPAYGGEDVADCRKQLQTISDRDMATWLS
ncbi:MAG: o-succinylbenzoate synthase, partial [Planctomycetota bacterium]